MASSAGSLLLSTVDNQVSPQSPVCPHLLGVSIPPPMVITSSLAKVLSVSIDAFSGQSRVHSVEGTLQTIHLSASFASSVYEVSTVPGSVAARRARALSICIAQSIEGRLQPSAVAVAEVLQCTSGPSSQYTVHPTFVDNCTQVISGQLFTVKRHSKCIKLNID